MHTEPTDTKGLPEKLNILPRKSQISLGVSPKNPNLHRLDKVGRETMFSPEFFAKSYNNTKSQNLSGEVKNYTLNKNIIQKQIQISPEGANSGVFFNNKSKRVTKKTNFEVQAALLQGRTVQKNLKTLRT